MVISQSTTRRTNLEQDSALLALQQKQAEEKRLMGLLIQNIQHTGECDYPALVALAEDTLAVEQSGGELLTQPQLQQLSQRLNHDLFLIEQAVTTINGNLDHLRHLIHSPETAASDWQLIGRHLRQAMTQLHNGVGDVIKQAKIYLPLNQKVKNSSSELAYEQMGWKQEIDDLDYICDYLDEHLQVEMIRKDYVNGGKLPLYFARLAHYQSLLPQLGKSLTGEILSQLEQKRTGGKFVLTHSF